MSAEQKLKIADGVTDLAPSATQFRDAVAIAGQMFSSAQVGGRSSNSVESMAMHPQGILIARPSRMTATAPAGLVRVLVPWSNLLGIQF